MSESEQSDDSARPESDDVVALWTSELDGSEGRDEWQHTLGHLYAEMDVDWPDRPGGLDAEWGGRPLGRLHFSSIRCDEQTVVRSPTMIQSDSCTDYLVCLVTDGHVEVTQSNRTAVLESGAFAILDLGSPFVFHSPATFRQVVVRVPHEAMASRLPENAARLSTGRSFDPHAGSVGVIGRLIVDLATTEMSTTIAESFSSSALEMLSAAIIEDTPTATPGELLRLQDLAHIRQVIDDNLHDPEFTLTDVAHVAGMSLRNVQKLVRTTGTTPGALLYDARVERAKMLLLNTQAPLTDISVSVGFRDVSHFSRVFRKQAGISPGRYRNSESAMGQ
ncbi:AraC family transcriptional regulator [Gordonia sp. ABSL49_1]|uniref:AraC family transcriptional regulator n=1 Tax=Gordonia sp. ABSL49_1 TaxID=2920941 RepID=UPI001F0FC53E|nr:AraC family transcriptional regulator [Gordonia sp. ABSL49_1]MCH5643241.1 AraC family transcriptional regulator [Gordonia sp. ABSL49_1]